MRYGKTVMAEELNNDSNPEVAEEEDIDTLRQTMAEYSTASLLIFLSFSCYRSESPLTIRSHYK